MDPRLELKSLAKALNFWLVIQGHGIEWGAFSNYWSSSPTFT